MEACDIMMDMMMDNDSEDEAMDLMVSESYCLAMDN